MEVTIIAAVNEAGYIGNKGKLMYAIPEDMAFFKEYTVQCGHVIMGRRTHESIGKDLPYRENHVLSHVEGEDTLAAKLKELEWAGVEEVCIIGGGEIYAAAEQYATRHIITVIKDSAEGDTRYESPLAANAEKYAFQVGVTDSGVEWYTVNSDDVLAGAMEQLSNEHGGHEYVDLTDVRNNSSKHLLTVAEKNADVEAGEADKDSLYQPDPYMTALLEFLQSLNHTEPCRYDTDDINGFLKMMATNAVLSDNMIAGARLVMDTWDGESGQALIHAIYNMWMQNEMLVDVNGNAVEEHDVPEHSAVEAQCGVGVNPEEFLHEHALGCYEDWWEGCRDIVPVDDLIGVIPGVGMQHAQHIDAIFNKLVHRVSNHTIYELSEQLQSGVERMLETTD